MFPPVNYRTAIVTLDWLLERMPTKIATGTALPGLRPRGSGTLICIKPAISPGAGPAYCNCAVEDHLLSDVYLDRQ